MADRGRRRGFGDVRKRPSRRLQASFVGPVQAKATLALGAARDLAGRNRRRLPLGSWPTSAPG